MLDEGGEGVFWVRPPSSTLLSRQGVLGKEYGLQHTHQYNGYVKAFCPHGNGRPSLGLGDLTTGSD